MKLGWVWHVDDPARGLSDLRKGTANTKEQAKSAGTRSAREALRSYRDSEMFTVLTEKFVVS